MGGLRRPWCPAVWNRANDRLRPISGCEGHLLGPLEVSAAGTRRPTNDGGCRELYHWSGSGQGRAVHRSVTGSPPILAGQAPQSDPCPSRWRPAELISGVASRIIRREASNELGRACSTAAAHPAEHNSG